MPIELPEGGSLNELNHVLNDVAQSQLPGYKGPKLYVCLNGQQLVKASAEEIAVNNSLIKLSIPQIQSLAKETIEGTNFPEKDAQFTSKVKNITGAIKQLSQARVEKQNTTSLISIACAIFTFFLAFPVFLAISQYKKLQKFEEDDAKVKHWSENVQANVTARIATEAAKHSPPKESAAGLIHSIANSKASQRMAQVIAPENPDGEWTLKHFSEKDNSTVDTMLLDVVPAPFALDLNRLHKCVVHFEKAESEHIEPLTINQGVRYKAVNDFIQNIHAKIISERSTDGDPGVQANSLLKNIAALHHQGVLADGVMQLMVQKGVPNVDGAMHEIEITIRDGWVESTITALYEIPEVENGVPTGKVAGYTVSTLTTRLPQSMMEKDVSEWSAEDLQFVKREWHFADFGDKERALAYIQTGDDSHQDTGPLGDVQLTP